MEAYSAPLRVLGEKVRSFVGLASEHGARSRLLHVATDALLRDAAIDIVMGFEHHADNWTPFVRLDEPYTEDGACWSANAIVLAAQHEARREAMAKHGHELARLGTIAASSSPIARFAAALSAVLDAQRAPLAGLTLVLAPGGVEDPSALERDVLSLARSPGLAAVRFVIVELGARELGKELAGATRAERAQIAVDDNLACTELEQRLDAAGAASPDLPGPAQVGAAWPKKARPERRTAARDPASMAAGMAALASSIGVPPAILGGALREVRASVLRGALALRRGDPHGATRHQSRAAQACVAAGLHREACLMDLILATYLVHAGERDLAEGRYRGCAERARDRGWADLSAQALMATGSLRLLSRDRSGASIAYAQAGRVAKDGKLPDLAIEGYRMAGQLALEDGNEEVASRAFIAAIALANGISPAAAGRTSAPMAARQLADHFTKSGLRPQAASLRQQADAFERAARAG